MSLGTFYSVRRDGTELVEVAKSPEVGVSLFHNWVWSPDGSKIASDDGKGSLYISNGDGTGTVRVAGGEHPSWSPDGTRVLFQSRSSLGDYDIFIINADGTGSSRLTSDPAYEVGPQWSPNGTRILYYSDKGHTNNAWVMKADGSSQVQLLGKELRDTDSASWSPDGNLIVFGGGLGSDIYVANADGSDIRNLTDTDWALEYRPAWSPLLPQDQPSPGSSLKP
jgi:TolB protein